MALPAGQQSRANAYNSFSGVDIKAVFNNKVAVPLQAFSYAIQREKAPIYTMGYPNPRAFSRGKRGIAGTLVFAMFDTHPLVGTSTGGLNDPLFSQVIDENKFWADEEEIKPSVDFTGGNATVNLSAVDANFALPGVEGDNFLDQRLVLPWYSDQIPPFNITLTASNEYGAVVSMSVVGCEIVNEGYGVSIDDLVSEMQYTFIARELLPWQRLQANDASGGATSF